MIFWRDWVTHPKMPPWALIIFQAHLHWKLRKVRAHTVFGYETFVSPVISFPNGGIDADLRGNSGDHQLLDAAILQDGMQIGGKECSALARLVSITRLRGKRVEGSGMMS